MSEYNSVVDQSAEILVKNQKMSGMMNLTDIPLAITSFPGLSTNSIYKDLYHRLSAPTDFSRFIHRAVEYLNLLGFSDWGYISPDFPADNTCDEIIGTNNKEYRKVYVSERFYENDMLMRHGADSPMPIFRSTFEQFLQPLRFMKDETIQRNCELIDMERRLGFNDVFLIPFTSCCDSHVIMTVCSKDTGREEFQRRVKNNFEKLSIFAQVVDKIGSECHPDNFIARREVYQQLMKSNLIEYLRLTHQLDINRKQVAQIMCKSVSSVEKYASAARELFDARTDHHAIERAIEEGFFERKIRKPIEAFNISKSISKLGYKANRPFFR